MKEMFATKNKGITLVMLIVTIVIMLILLSVTLVGIGINGGLFGYARTAKLSSEDAQIIEGIQNAYILAKGKSKTTVVNENELQNQVNIALPDKNATVVKEGNGFVVLIGDKYYEIANNGTVSAPQVFDADPYPGDITRGKNGTYTGTQDDPYRIECIEDLVKLSAMAYKDQARTSTKYYLLTRDLDFNSIFSYANYKAKYSYIEADNAYEPDENATTTIKELCTTGIGFIPIGLEYGNSGATKVFAGTFFGKEPRTIKNVFIKTSNYAGLFGATISTTIKNITIEGSITSTANTAAGIVANGNYTTIKKCYNKAKIEGKTNAAGIFGTGGTKVTIIECGNEGDISCINNGIAAGISQSFVVINKCYNKGKIECKNGWIAAGICGRSIAGTPPTLKNNYNLGEIKGTCSGGISCWCSANIYNCLNVGEISGIAANGCAVARHPTNYNTIYNHIYKLLFYWKALYYKQYKK